MDRLSIILSLMTGATITGVLAITVMTLGLYSWVWIGGAAVIGFALSWPASYWVSRQIKRQDPAFDDTRVERTDALPRLGEREV